MDTDIKWLKEGEGFDDLELNGLQIIQHKNKYRFTTDSVLLSSFAKIKTDEIVADLGTGSGIIAILLAAKTKAKHIYGIELQEYMADMATRSTAYNNLSDKISIICTPMQQAYKTLGQHILDVVISNPPYRKLNCGDCQKEDEITVSRHEVKVTLQEVAESAAKLLKFGGKFFMIHQAERLTDILCALRDNKLEPKRIRFVINKAGAVPSHVLIEALSNGKSGLIVEKNLIVYCDNGEYTSEARAIYYK